ncbi:ABC transporter ATP-binding protein [Thermodesulforhabdus norvegica]|uniref:ABC-2 type transport system ATP-binding protein n=1 Tax=Thermodesulforhabdus norvegica TaxID=39841 RepID=A0A1I4UW44_9BACT|nr:ATP-binding cassette domain-containing protein [Thermodesulforhabdus norvegica]SFM93095.1 ABC-2 type transport system ATP-binding protein [Thermodesulforhabdus norvegica]
MIDVRGLTKYYGAIPAIQDVSFQVEKGEIVGFLGPNGAGKSTTIKILTCYMPPSAGVARIDGLDCFEHSLEVRKRIGYLPETVPLYTEMTVRRFLQFSASSKGIPARHIKKEVDRVVDVCGLKPVAHRIIGNLSKGYRQRVGLAQALIGNPPVIILDEPTIGLDPAQIVEMRNLIKSLAGEHTVFLSSHILPEVAQTCQRVVIINKGRIVATDTPEQLTQKLQTTKQVKVSLDRPAELADLQRLFSEIDGITRIVSEDGNPARWIIETDQSREVRPAVARVLVENGYGLLELKSVDLSLEEVFMQLVTEEKDLQEASVA